MRSSLAGYVCAVVLLVAATTPGPVTRAAASLPGGFVDEVLTDSNTANAPMSIPFPTALAFTPDGRLLIAQKSGALRVYQNGGLLASPALSLGSETLCDELERGLIGVAVDPAFATNHFIYLYYPYNQAHVTSCPQRDPTNPNNPVNRLSRFTLGDDNRATGEVVLVDNIPSTGIHNAGDLHFGADGYLYVAVGDGGCQITPPYGCAGENANTRRLN